MCGAARRWRVWGLVVKASVLLVNILTESLPDAAMRKNLFELLQIEVDEVGERGRAHLAVGAR